MIFSGQTAERGCKKSQSLQFIFSGATQYMGLSVRLFFCLPMIVPTCLILRSAMLLSVLLQSRGPASSEGQGFYMAVRDIKTKSLSVSVHKYR